MNYQTPSSLRPMNSHHSFPVFTGYPSQKIVSIPFLKGTQQTLMEKTSSFDYNQSGTKRIRLSQHQYAEAPHKSMEIPFLRQNSDDMRFSGNHYHNIPKERVKDPRNYQPAQAEAVSLHNSKNYNFGDELIIPPLRVRDEIHSDPIFTKLSQNSIQDKTSNFLQCLKASQQLSQQKIEYVIQQQLLQKQRLQDFIKQKYDQQRKSQLIENLYRQFEASTQEKSISPAEFSQHYPNYEVKSSLSVKRVNSGFDSSRDLVTFERDVSGQNFSSTTETQASEDGFEYVKIEALDFEMKCKNVKDIKKQEAKKIKTDILFTKAPVKQKIKQKNQNRVLDYFGTTCKDPLKKISEGPRKKNTWQCKVEQESQKIFQQSHEGLENSEVKVENEHMQKKKLSKLIKPVEVPQHMQDDSMIDFNQLLSTTITSDQNQGFVVIRKDFKSADMDEIGGETRVGSNFQALIPEVKERNRKEKRYPELVWRPDAIKESELKSYLADVCGILKCDDINEERALKLLKRKKFKKEKVKVNVSKNEKFYSSYLVVNDNKNSIEEGSLELPP